MQVLNAHAGLLSNGEVLQVLRDDHQESQRISSSYAEARAFQDGKLEEAGKPVQRYHKSELNKLINPPHVLEMRRLATKHLEEEIFPSRVQSTPEITRLTKALREFGGGTLTRAEKLQIVNSGPVEMVHLFVIVDQLMDRIPDEEERERLLDLVRTHIETCKDGRQKDGDKGGEKSSQEREAAELEAQSQKQRAAAQEAKQHEMEIAEAVQEEEQELEEFDEEEEEEEEMLIDDNYGRGNGGGDAGLELDEAPEGEV